MSGRPLRIACLVALGCVAAALQGYAVSTVLGVLR